MPRFRIVRLSSGQREIHQVPEVGHIEPVAEIVSNELSVEPDPVSRFLRERCEIAGDAAVPARALYAAFVRWAEASQVPLLTQTALGRRLSSEGFGTDRKGAGGTVRRLGIRLRPEA